MSLTVYAGTSRELEAEQGDACTIWISEPPGNLTTWRLQLEAHTGGGWVWVEELVTEPARLTAAPLARAVAYAHVPGARGFRLRVRAEDIARETTNSDRIEVDMVADLLQGGPHGFVDAEIREKGSAGGVGPAIVVILPAWKHEVGWSCVAGGAGATVQIQGATIPVPAGGSDRDVYHRFRAPTTIAFAGVVAWHVSWE